jgi:hypothetical protein
MARPAYPSPEAGKLIDARRAISEGPLARQEKQREKRRLQEAKSTR